MAKGPVAVNALGRSDLVQYYVHPRFLPPGGDEDEELGSEAAIAVRIIQLLRRP